MKAMRSTESHIPEPRALQRNGAWHQPSYGHRRWISMDIHGAR
jgi:hypothetical protein